MKNFQKIINFLKLFKDEITSVVQFIIKVLMNFLYFIISAGIIIVFYQVFIYSLKDPSIIDTVKLMNGIKLLHCFSIILFIGVNCISTIIKIINKEYVHNIKDVNISIFSAIIWFLYFENNIIKLLFEDLKI